MPRKIIPQLRSMASQEERRMCRLTIISATGMAIRNPAIKAATHMRLLIEIRPSPRLRMLKSKPRRQVPGQFRFQPPGEIRFQKRRPGPPKEDRARSFDDGGRVYIARRPVSRW